MASQPARTHEGLSHLFLFLANILLFLSFSEIEEQIREIQAKKVNISHENGDEDDGRISMSLSKANMDSDIYGDNHNKYANYNTSIAANDDNDYEVCL